MIICAEKSLNLQKHPSNFHIFLILISPYFNVKITNQKKTFQGPGKGRPQVWLLKTFKEPVHPSGAPLRDTRRSRERGQLLGFPFSALSASLYLPRAGRAHMAKGTAALQRRAKILLPALHIQLMQLFTARDEWPRQAFTVRQHSCSSCIP